MRGVRYVRVEVLHDQSVVVIQRNDSDIIDLVQF